jgi:hypothetical protein
VELKDGIDGLVHISQISEERIEKIKDVLKPGQEVTARVIKIDRDERRLGLSIKAANYSEQQLAAETSAYEAIGRSAGSDMMNLGDILDFVTQGRAADGYGWGCSAFTSPPEFMQTQVETFREMVRHENELMNHRVSWLLTLQGLLFTALGFAWDKADAHALIYVFCATGAVVAISSQTVLNGARQAIDQLRQWWR